MARIRLSDLAAQVGGRWRVEGLGVLVIRDFHSVVVLVEWEGFGNRWSLPLFDLKRIGEPIGRSHEN